MQRLADGILGVAKESAKTVSREAFNATIRFVNGASGAVLAFFPGRESIVEGLQGWELRPTFRAPRLPRWMEEGVSSFNQFVHDCAANVDDSGSDSEYESDNDSAVSVESDAPSTPYSSFTSSPGSVAGHGRRRNHDRSFTSWLLWWMRWLLWPIVGIFRDNSRPAGVPRRMSRSSSSSSIASGGGRSLRSHASLSSLGGHLSRRLNEFFEYATHVNDHRRRGILEDLQLIAELAIEKVFEFVRKLVHSFLSPWQSIAALVRRLTEPPVQRADKASALPGTSSMNVESSARQRLLQMQQTLNMDCRTCGDIITEAGYPYEALKVTTEDGYVLQLERIPRRSSRKVVYLQHGLLDSSLGWVSNGVIGSQAFAAYDQGFDVFLGNFRGYASQEHVTQKISAKHYWNYSVNEHGMMDIPAIVERIHAIKMSELGNSLQPMLPAPQQPAQLALPSASASHEGARSSASSNLQVSTEIEGGGSTSGKSQDDLPYSLTAVTHSLGGAAILTYVVTRQLAKKPHRLSRLILLSPAGFHAECPFLFKFIGSFFPFIDPIMTRYLPGFYIPTRGLRLLFNKLAQDFQNLPALRALVQVLISSMMVGGDASDWVGSLRTPHYNMYNMPGLSYRVAKHLSQMWKAGRFILYDHGSPEVNMRAYGSVTPLDVGSKYNLINIPVDVVSGKRDRLIPPSMVLRHYLTMKEAGVEVTLKEFEYAHLDFTFAHKENLLAYVMSRLTLPPVGFRGLAEVEDIFRRQREGGDRSDMRSLDRSRAKGNAASPFGSPTAASIRRRGKSPAFVAGLLEGPALTAELSADNSARASGSTVTRTSPVNSPSGLTSRTSTESSGHVKGGNASTWSDSTPRLTAWLQQLVAISPLSAPAGPRGRKGRLSTRKRHNILPPVLSGVAEGDEQGEDEIEEGSNEHTTPFGNSAEINDMRD